MYPLYGIPSYFEREQLCIRVRHRREWINGNYINGTGISINVSNVFLFLILDFYSGLSSRRQAIRANDLTLEISREPAPSCVSMTGPASYVPRVSAGDAFVIAISGASGDYAPND